MSVASDTIYWAERAVGEPFQPPDLAALRRKYMRASLLSGLAFASTIAAGAAAGWLLIPDRPQRVVLAQFAYAPGLAVNRAAQSPAPVVTAPSVPASPPKPAPAKPPRPSSPARTEPRPTAPSKVKRPAPAKVATEQPLAAPLPAISGALVEIVPPRPPQEPPVQVSTPAPAPSATRAGLTAAAASKPQDIAPSEKLGVRAVFAEGIELLNGKRIRNGDRLPNGELLQATDPAKGMVETDRRVMTIVR